MQNKYLTNIEVYAFMVPIKHGFLTAHHKMNFQKQRQASMYDHTRLGFNMPDARLARIYII